MIFQFQVERIKAKYYNDVDAIKKNVKHMSGND